MLAPWKSLAGLMQTVVCRALERLGSRTTRRARAGYIHSREPSVQRRWTCSTARERGSQLKPLPRQYHQSVTNDTHGAGRRAQQSLPSWLPRDTGPTPNSDSVLTTLKLTSSSWAPARPHLPPQLRRREGDCSPLVRGKEPQPLSPTGKSLQHPGKWERATSLRWTATRTGGVTALVSAQLHGRSRWGREPLVRSRSCTMSNVWKIGVKSLNFQNYF